MIKRFTTKLQYSNEWEAHRYHVGDDMVAELKVVQIGKASYHVYRVLDHKLLSDQGHQHCTTSKRYYVKIKIHGVPVRQYLDVLLQHGLVIKVVGWKAVA